MRPSSPPGGPLWRAAFAVLIVLGAVLRLFDWNDPPLDFHPTRQLRNLLVARSIYYDLQPGADEERRELSASFRRSVGLYEPPIVESLVGATFLLTGENLAIPRLYATVFWLLAAFALFELARRTTSPVAGLIAAAYFLVLPFSVQASRSFQPDPLMTAAFIGGIYFLYRWSDDPRWLWAFLAGAFLGLAALVKIVIAFLVGGAAIALVACLGPAQLMRSRQFWAMAGLMVVPAFAYYILGTPARSTEYFFAWTVTLIDLILSAEYYSKWLALLGSLLGQTMLAIGIFGTILAAPRLRAILLGIWAGYFLYGLTLPFQMYTHSYYHIQLIPVVALGLALVAHPLLERVQMLAPGWKVVAATLVLAAVGYQAWVARSVLAAEDFRTEPALWETVGAAVPADAKAIALTQDYGYRLMYWGWRKADLWPISTDLSEARAGSQDAASDFASLTAGKDFFLVTAFGQLEKQPGLREMLERFPVAAQGPGYVIYDLRP